MPGPSEDDLRENVAPGSSEDDVGRRVLGKLAGIVSALAQIEAPPGQRVLHFVFTVFQPDPAWPTNLRAFPVPLFRDAAPIPPGGTADNPILIAINAGLGDDDQAIAVAQYVVSTMRRHAAVAEVLADRAALSSLTDGVDALDRVSQSEAIAMARAIRAGRRDEMAIAAGQLGFGVRARVIPSWLPDQAGFAARVPFFARCYNEMRVVRDAVDRIVSATVGVGPRVSSASEQARLLAERWVADQRTALYAAQALRDAVLMGAGAVATSVVDGQPRLRVIRPDRLDLGTRQSAPVREMIDSEWRDSPDAAVLLGTAQPNSAYGASLLDPWVLTLYVALEIGSHARDMQGRLPAPEQMTEAAVGLAETIETSKTMATAAEGSLANHLQSVFGTFAEPRYPLYLRGHERWP